MTDDHFRIPPYSDTIAIPFHIPPGLIGPRPKRTVAVRPDRPPAEQTLADAPPNGQPDGRAPAVHTVRGASPAAASGEWPRPAVALVVAQVRGHDDLVVSGFSDGPLTLYRRGNDQPPRPLASFAADLDGSFWSGDGKFLGRMVANEVALFHPDWLRSIDAGPVQIAGDAHEEGAEPENPAQRELEKEFRHLEEQIQPLGGAGPSSPAPGEQRAAPAVQPPVPIVPSPGPTRQPGQARDQREGPPATAPTGRRGNPLYVVPGTNPPATIGGRYYSRHALDEMQTDGITPSAVEHAIAKGLEVPSSEPETFRYYDPLNGIEVVINRSGRVVSTWLAKREDSRTGGEGNRK